MSLNDYIIEYMSNTSNVDVEDIEIVQTFAELAVLEAMMDCYEKQAVMLEYNDEAASNIMMESVMIPLIMEGTQTAEEEMEAANQQNAGFNTTERPSGSKNAGAPKKAKGVAFKRFMSRIGNAIAKLGAAIVDALTSYDFNKLADKIEKTPNFSKMLKEAFAEDNSGDIASWNAMIHIDTLIKVVDEYQNTFGDIAKLNAENWYRSRVPYIQKLKNMTASISHNIQADKRKDTEAAAVDENGKEISFWTNPETKNMLIRFCRTFGKNDIKKKIRKFKEQSAKFNIDYAENNNIPEDVANEMRKFTSQLLKFYTGAAKALKKLSKSFNVVGKVAKNVGALDNDEIEDDDTAVEAVEAEKVESSDYNNESFSMELTDDDYYQESTRGEVAKSNFLAWLIGGIGLRKTGPYEDYEFHWPKLVMTLFGLGVPSTIWAMIEDHNMMRENIDEVINVEAVKAATEVLDCLNVKKTDVEISTVQSKFKRALKKLIKECKYDTKKANDASLRSKVNAVGSAAERVSANMNSKDNLRNLVDAINSLLDSCLDKSKLSKVAKSDSKNVTEYFSM